MNHQHIYNEEKYFRQKIDNLWWKFEGARMNAKHQKVNLDYYKRTVIMQNNNNLVFENLKCREN